MENWLRTAVNNSKNHIAVIFKEKRYTYQELFNNSVIYAKKLKKLGINRGDHVGVLLKTRIEYVFLIYALIELQSVFIPLNIQLSDHLLKEQIVHADISFLISNRDIIIDGIKIIKLSEIKNLDINEDNVEYTHSKIDLNKLHCIIFTSGSTGKPKGVMLSYNNHYSSAISSAKILGMKKQDVWLDCIPLYHVGGLEILFRSCIYRTTVSLHEIFNTDEIINSIYSNKITIISLVPTMLVKILAKNKLSDVNKLRCILLGGAKANTKLVKTCIDLNLPIALTYGMTEGTSQIATATIDKIKKKNFVVGPPLDGTTVKIVPIANEDIIGEIHVMGNIISKGYYNAPNLNKEKFVDNYFNTGDLGYFDNEDLVIVQRKYDLIISGGENILPSEVEDILIQMDEIEDVVIFGENDDHWGQIVVAALIGNKLTVDKILKFCVSKIAKYKIPKKFYKFDKFPHTGSGKIHRKRIIKIYKSQHEIN